jgi:hypothetical protein
MKRKQRKQYPNTSLKKEKLKTENACKSHAQFEDNGHKMYTIIMNAFFIVTQMQAAVMRRNSNDRDSAGFGLNTYHSYNRIYEVRDDRVHLAVGKNFKAESQS